MGIFKRRKFRRDFWGYFDGRIPGYGDVARVAHDGFTCLPDETERESPTANEKNIYTKQLVFL